MKSPKGAVTVKSFRGRLRLQLPRQVFDGEQKYLSMGLPDTPTNRAVAQAKAQKIELDIVMERFDSSLARYASPYTQFENLPEIGEIWEKYSCFKSKTISKTTLEKDYKVIYNHIKKFPSQKIGKAKRIKEYLLDNCSIGTAKKVLLYLKACCEWAMMEDLIPRNPFFTFKIRTKRKRSINPFTISEQEKIIDAFEGNHYQSYVKFLFWTGCRPSEAIALTWGDIDPALENITFKDAVVQGIGRTGTTKTKNTRRFPCNEQLRSLLRSLKPEMANPTEPVFRSVDGCVVDAHNFLNREWKPTLAKLPIAYRVAYNARHTFITLCLEQGIPVAQIAAWVGNSPKTIWESYAGLVSSRSVPEF